MWSTTFLILFFFLSPRAIRRRPQRWSRFLSTGSLVERGLIYTGYSSSDQITLEAAIYGRSMKRMMNATALLAGFTRNCRLPFSMRMPGSVYYRSSRVPSTAMLSAVLYLCTVLDRRRQWMCCPSVSHSVCPSACRSSAVSERGWLSWTMLVQVCMCRRMWMMDKG